FGVCVDQGREYKFLAQRCSGREFSTTLSTRYPRGVGLTIKAHILCTRGSEAGAKNKNTHHRLWHGCMGVIITLKERHMQAFRFGVFDHMDRGTVSIGEQYRNRLQLVRAYDDVGFYAYHLAEHHSTPLGVAPSPSVFLAAVAQH